MTVLHDATTTPSGLELAVTHSDVDGWRLHVGGETIPPGDVPALVAAASLLAYVHANERKNPA